MNGFEWYVENRGLVRTLARSMCRGDWAVIAELEDHALDRIQDIVSRYEDWHGASLSTHVYANLKWYMWKYMNRREKRACSHFSLDERMPGRELPSNLEALDEVQWILDNAPLTEKEKYLILMHAGHGWTIREIAEHNDYGSVATVRLHYIEAMRKVRSFVAGRTDTDTDSR